LRQVLHQIMFSHVSHKFSTFCQPVFKIAVLTMVGLLVHLSDPIESKGEGLTKNIVRAVEPQRLDLVVGKSVVLNSEKSIKRASLADPQLASTLVLSPTQLYLNGKAAGGTNLTFWGRDGKVFAIYDVRVAPDLQRLKTHLHELFPNEKGIEVRSAHDHITLAGAVSGPEIMTQVLGLAKTYAPKKVMNLMHVGGVQQVMLEVTVAEMRKGLLKRLGVNFLNTNKNGENVQIGLLDGISSFDDDNGILTHIFGTTANFSTAFNVGSSTVSLILAALKQHNLTKILAEPTLIAISGQEASFLAGGEFPIPVPQAFGVTTIKFKKFGVRLNFNPTVLSDGKISLKLAPEVSELAATTVDVGGLNVPSLTTNRVETIVELRDGQSFAIAGLLKENVVERIAKYPFVGDIPILGTLFRSSDFDKGETELIILVTPHLVKPLDKSKQSLPTDSYLEPNDFELMLMGYLEGVKPYHFSKSQPPDEDKISEPLISPVNPGGGLEGQFGHLAP